MIVEKLKELKSLDPNLWKEISNFGYIGGESNGNYDRWAENYDDSPPESDYIQGCIQREVERRKWYWKVEKFHNTYYVNIIIPYECAPDENFRCHGKCGITEVFLDTYLKAIKFQIMLDEIRSQNESKESSAKKLVLLVGLPPSSSIPNARILREKVSQDMTAEKLIEQIARKLGVDKNKWILLVFTDDNAPCPLDNGELIGKFLTSKTERLYFYPKEMCSTYRQP